MSIIDISNETQKIFHLSENDALYNTLNDNFDSIKPSKITSIYKNKNFFLIEKKKIPSLMEIEKKVHDYFMYLYYQGKDFYNIKVISDIINNSDTHLVAEFKDYLIMGDESEFLQRKYNMKECKKYLPILFDYYKSCSIIFPNYVLLHENKYIFKNIRKKQKVIDNQQEQDEKREKIKNGEIVLNDNADFFTTKTMNSILNQTNTSYMRLFFGINKSQDKSDSQETVNDIFKNIVKAEHQVLLANKKNYILKKNLQKILKDDKNKEKIINITNSNNNTINLKLNRGKKEFGINKNVNINNEEKDNNDKNNKINILYSNRNIIVPRKIIKKINTNAHHVKSNTCTFETDINKFFPKKVNLDINNPKLSKKVLNNNNNSNRRIFYLRDNKKKEKLTNKEIISKIMAKIKNANSAIFQMHNSFNSTNKKRIILNMRKYKKSISPMNESNRKKNNFDFIININESNSTPNICNLIINKNNRSQKKIIKKENETGKEKNSEIKLIKVNSNLDISPVNKFLQKTDSYINTNNHKIYSNNINSLKYANNNILRNSLKNKILQNKHERKKVNFNIYKVTPNTNTHKCYSNNNSKIGYPQSTNKAMTISGMKTLGEQKFESIKVVKKQRTINSKKLKKADINNNININININSNNIYNNTNQLSNSNNNSIQNSSSININNNSVLSKSKYYDLLRQSSSFISNRNNRYPNSKKMLLSSASNNNICINSKKNFMLEEMNKKKKSVLNTNNNTLTFSGCATSRNSHNSSKIKNIIKKSSNKNGNIKTNYSSNKMKIKKELLNKKELNIYSKNKIPVMKSPKSIKSNCKTFKK